MSVQRPPRAFEPYKLYIASGMAIAVFGGFILGLLVPVSRALGWGWEASRPDIVHVHGQLQLAGFAGLYVMAMSMRLLPRFGRLRLRFEALVYPIWALVVASLLLRALVLPWLPDDAHSAGVLGAELLGLAASAAFFLVISGSLLTQDRELDATGYFFLFGALMLLVEGFASAFVAIDELDDPTRVFAYLPDSAIQHLQLFGFVLAFVAGVSGRIVPTMVGLPRSERLGLPLAFLHAAAVLGLAGALLWLEYRDYSEAVERLAALATALMGVAFLGFVWQAGIFRAAAQRLRPASQPHLWLVRSAFAWLAFAGGYAVYLGAKGLAEGTLATQSETDALRHAVAVGLVVTLIMGMSLLILPEFAGERMVRSRQGWLSYALLGLVNAAGVLRVGPALAGTDWTIETGSWLMAAGGIVAETAMVVFALSFVRLLAAGIPVPESVDGPPVDT